MNSRNVIHHPGPETNSRVVSARGEVSRHSLLIPKHHKLLDAVAKFMEETNSDSGVVILDGVTLGPFDYVMPSQASDDFHAAWYSKTLSCKSATLRHATATIGRRDGLWWVHCHALWQAGSLYAMGHLLPDSLTISSDSQVTLYGFKGGSFEVTTDPETAFPVFHVKGGGTVGNGCLAKINPHEDIGEALQTLIRKLRFSDVDIYGIGSLIGARFSEGVPMECPISEVLVLPEARYSGSLTLPVHCVDIDNNHFQGVVAKAPVLVTFEVLIVQRGSV